MKMNKEFLESLAKYLEKFISDEVEKRCKKLEDEKNAAECDSQRYKRWLLFLIKDNAINLDKLYEEAEKESREWEEDALCVLIKFFEFFDILIHVCSIVGFNSLF